MHSRGKTRRIFPRGLVRALNRVGASALFLSLAFAAPALAEVERIDLDSAESLAGGRSYGTVGPYEKISGRVRLALDPTHPGNALIVDLGLAPRDPDGKVRYSADIHILRPVDRSRGNGTILCEISNRGSKAMVRYFNRDAARTMDPTSEGDLGDGFLMRRGFTLVWIGWQYDVPQRSELLRLYPVRTIESIEGLVRSDHVFAERSTTMALSHRNHLGYPVADPDDPRNQLTVRDRRLGKRRKISRDRWSFARIDEGRVVPDETQIHFPEGFEPGRIYEMVYVAERPAIVGLGLSAIRDVVTHLKHDPSSPVEARRAIGFGISQTGRFLRHYLYQGFNAGLDGRAVFDGVWAHTAGAGRGSFNHRFGQPSRDAHAYSAFFYPTDIFPFTGATQKDPRTGIDDGLLRRLDGTAAMPKIFFTNTGYEYWGRAASLIHTAIDGRADQPLHENVRAYHFSSTQHFVDRFPPRPSGTVHPANPANFLWNLRALLDAMQDWIQRGTAPPPSRYPKIADGTLVAPGRLDFPKLPGIRVPERPHEAYRADYGPRFRTQGIVDHQPPRLGRAFPVLVSQVDADGNELAGIRLPEIAVPLATYAPWNLRSPESGAETEMADFRGSFIVFPSSPDDARASHDPRISISERYNSRDAYLGRYAAEAVKLVRARYLLAEDLPEVLEHASELWDLATVSRTELSAVN